MAGVHTNKAVALQKEKRKTVSKRSEKALESGDIQAVVDTLSEKQRLFCEEYLKDLNGAQAVLRAGYRTSNAKQIAHQLLENPAVRLAIDALRAERNTFSDVTKDFVLKTIVKTIEKAEEDGNHNAVLRGSELLARHLGMFVERTEISGPDGEAIKYEKAKEDAADFLGAISSLAARRRAE